MTRLIEHIEAELAHLPSVAFKTVQLAVLDVLTLVWGVVTCFTHDSHDTVPIYNAWLIYLAALHGVNLYAFKTATSSTTTTASGQELVSSGTTGLPSVPPTPSPVPLG